MRVVVTGAGGLIGWHLVDELVRRGASVQAWTRSAPGSDWGDKVQAAEVDVCDPNAVAHHIGAFAPDLVVHLAAQSLPGKSWIEPALTYQVNVVGTIHLLEAARRLAERPRILVAGSSAEYADSAADKPLDETTTSAPNSPYAASKRAAIELAQLYRRRYDLDLIGFRPFLISGPRKTGDVCSDFARRIVAIERGADSVMRVGALDVVRDIVDVRDGVSAILRIADDGKGGEIYNIASGVGVRIRDILETYRSLATVPIKVTVDPELMRPLEQQIRIGDPAKLRALGWERKYRLEETLRAILDYWRSVKA